MTGPPEPQVVFTPQPDGKTQAEVFAGGRAVSRLLIVRIPIQIGTATLLMDGIADVSTERDARMQGHARRLLEATVDHMRAGDAALTMLYGIAGFYHRFGYATAGPEHLLHLVHLDRPAALPPGWSARPIAPEDLPAVQRLYRADTAGASGAAIRPGDYWVWERLRPVAEAPPDGEDGGAGCDVLTGPDGEVGAYVWRGRDFWPARQVERNNPDDLVLAEAVAGSPEAARAALAHCRLWAARTAEARGRPIRRVTIGANPRGAIARRAELEDAVLERQYSANAGSMARVLNPSRLLTALAPELTERWTAARLPPTGSLTVETGEGSATFTPSAGGARPDGGAPGAYRVRLPQTALARLALGAFPPEGTLDTLDAPPAGREREALCALFPERHPHMHWPDRY